MMLAAAFVNPYRGKDFLEFFSVLFGRLFHFIKGDLSASSLASDEIQLLVLIGLSISAAFVGTFLVLKQMTMLANALCHTILLGIVLAFILLHPFFFSKELVSSSSFISLEVLLIASLLSGLLTTLLTQFLIHVMKLQEDASIGLVFTTLFALGVVLVTVFTRSVHLGTEAIMGNIDALDFDDLKLVFSLAAGNAAVFILFFKEFTVTTFDGAFSRSIGIPIHFFNYFLMVLTAATSIAAFRAVGVLLVLAFFVGPVLIGRLLTDRLKPLIALSLLIGTLGSMIAIALSRHLLSVYQIPVSTAGLVVTVISGLYFLLLVFAPKKGIVARARRKKRFQQAPINIDT